MTVEKNYATSRKSRRYMERKLYFAYGSNMNPVRAAQRVPGAKFLAVGILHNYRLAERLYADIEPAPDAEVHGVLYEVGDREIMSLDRFEGYPTVYTRIPVTIETNAGAVSAFTYIMTEEARHNRDGQPYPEAYRLICSAGACHHGIPDEFMI